MAENFNEIENLPVAHFANEFALNGRVDFNNAREWVIFLYLVAQLDPVTQETLPESMIPLSDLKKVIESKGKRSGGLYQEIRQASRRMAKVVCEFESDVFIDGKPLPVYIPIFQKIGAKKIKGSIYISYKFNEEMKPLLLGFRRNFFGIKPPKGIVSGHAIRFLLFAKAERDRKRKYDGKNSTIDITIDRLKGLLKLEGQYARFNNFRARVIDPIINGVNKSGVLEITNVEYVKEGRSIKNILFTVEDIVPVEFGQKDPKGNTPVVATEILALTHAQKKAFDFLVEKEIYEGIAIRMIINKMPSSICEGYEDFFCEEIYNIVVEKSKVTDMKGRAAILVDWFKKDIFKNDHFSRIIENVHSRKKALTLEQLSNREMAKRMTDIEFRMAYKKMQELKK